MIEFDKSLFYRDIGLKIKQEREKNKVSQNALAEQVSVSRTSIINIEKGRQYPPLSLIWEIAFALKIDPSQLIPSVDDIIKVSQEEQIKREAEKYSDGNRVKAQEESSILIQFYKEQQDDLQKN